MFRLKCNKRLILHIFLQ